MALERHKRDTIFPGNEWIDSLGRLSSPPVSRSTGRLKRPDRNSYGEDPRPEGDPRTVSPANRKLVSDAATIVSPRQKRLSRGTEPLLIVQASPWTNYKPLFNLQFGIGRYITVAETAVSTLNEDSSLVIIQRLLGPDIESQIQLIQQIQHPNFVATRQVFCFEDAFSVSYEFMPLSLSELAGNPLLNELHLASILGQVIDGLSYLEKKGLEHGRLTCSNILIDQDGNVKLWGYEYSLARSSTCKDIRALSFIAMELMQGYTKDDGAVGIDDLGRWPSDSCAVQFLAATTYATEIAQLVEHRLLKLPWRRNRLKGLVSLANIWASRGYKYPA